MALIFDSTTDDLTTTTSLPTYTAFTMMCWVYRLGNGGPDYEAVLSFCSFNRAYTLNIRSGGTVRFALGNWTADFNGTSLSNNTWYHVAMVCNGNSTGNLLGYLNGALDVTGDGTSSNSGINRLQVSDSEAGGNEYINARVAAVKIYSAALSAADVVQEMRQYAPVRTANLNRWLPMVDPTANNNAIDFAGTGNMTVGAGTLTVADGPPIPWAAAPRRALIIGGGASVTEKNGTDTVALSLSDSATLLGILLRTDTSALSLSEAQTSLLASSRTDSTAVSITDAATLLAILDTVADTAAVSASDLATLVAVLERTDTAAISLSDAVTLLGILSRTDTAALSVSETATLLGLLERTDTSAVSLTDTSAIQAAFTASDTAALTVADASTLLGILARTDSAGVALTDTAEIASFLSTADTAGLSLSEAIQLLAILQEVSDTLGVSLSDAATVFDEGAPIAKAGTDTVALGVTIDLTAFAALLSQQDTVAVTVTDARVGEIAVALSRSDSVAISVADLAAILAGITAGDSVALSIADSSTLVMRTPSTAGVSGLTLLGVGR